MKFKSKKVSFFVTWLISGEPWETFSQWRHALVGGRRLIVVVRNVDNVFVASDRFAVVVLQK